MPSIERRELLKAGGVLGAVAALGGAALGGPTLLTDLRVMNRRDEPTAVDLRLTANGLDALERTLEMPPNDTVHLPCDWPRPALFYELSVRPEGHDTRETIRYDEFGEICKKVAIEDRDVPQAPVTFYSSYPCPTNLSRSSCG
jgi:hypothetical protein